MGLGLRDVWGTQTAEVSLKTSEHRDRAAKGNHIGSGFLSERHLLFFKNAPFLFGNPDVCVREAGERGTRCLRNGVGSV